MNKLESFCCSLLAAVATFAFATRVWAGVEGVQMVSLQQDEQDAPPPEHRGPPPAAFDACASKAVGDACGFSINNHALQGTCAAPPPDVQDSRLACRPAGGPGGHRPPPRQSF